MPRIQTVHIPAETKNLAINGALDFWQEKAGATTTVNTSSGTSGYSADMFAYQSGGVSTHNYSLVRSTDVPTVAQSGFQSQYSILFTNLTGLPSFAAGDWREPFVYKMEGLDYAKIHSRKVTYGFWIKASVVGTYSFALKNASLNRSYVTTFSVDSANTWEFKLITVQMDSSGTWAFDNTIGLQVHIGSITGTNFRTSTLGQWQSGNFVMASTATNYQATTNATVRLAQFSIVEGSLGFGAIGFQRAGKTIQQELALCQRYFAKTYPTESAPGSTDINSALGMRALSDTSSGSIALQWSVPVHLRVNPTVTLYNPVTGATGSMRNTSASTNGTANVPNSGMTSVMVQNTFTLTLGDYYYVHIVADARL